MKNLLFSLLLVGACQMPPETEPRPERTEVRVVYVYIDRDDCMRGMAPTSMHCGWGFYGRNRMNVMPMRGSDICSIGSRFDCRGYYGTVRPPINRTEPRRGTPPQRPEGAQRYQPRPNRPEPPRNRPEPPRPPKPPLDK